MGKSLCAKALATYFARQGLSTLLVELSEEESEEGHDTIQPFQMMSKKLHFLRIYPDQALYEYLSLKVPGQSVLKKLLGKSFFRTLCSAMPGLSDLTRLGKIWFHADPIHGSSEKNFDKIVVDLPSSGFIERFLSIAQVVREVVRIGPLAKEARLMEDFFKDPNNAVLHLITLPEDLVINETFEIYNKISAAHYISLGMLVVNRLNVLNREELISLASKLEPSLTATKAIFEFFLSQVDNEHEQLKRLDTIGLKLPRIYLGEHFGAFFESEIIDEFVEKIAEPS